MSNYNYVQSNILHRSEAFPEEYREKIIQNLEEIYYLGFADGRNKVQDDITKALGIDT